jgi:hypothetical protein
MKLRRQLRGAGLACGVLLGLALVACRQEQSSDVASDQQWFEDVTKELGVDFVHDPGPLGNYFFPQIMGSGTAVFDFDNDGALDIYLLQNAGPNSPSRNRLFRQLANGRFQDVSDGSGLDVAGWGMGVAIGDVNNDGRRDVLVSEYGRLRLFVNNGRFRDVTQESGLESALWGTSACFFDYDRNGWLDLAVANYLEYNPQKTCGDTAGKREYCGPKAFESAGTRLYRNLGPSPANASVRFEDVTAKSGLGRAKGAALGVACTDLTGDRWPDILVANDSSPNHLWTNRHDGTFEEEGVVRGIAYDAAGRPPANMGVAMGDVNGDGLADVYITHLPAELHNLWKQDAPGYFRDQTAALGLGTPGWRSTGFGTVMVDFDLDGSLDIAVANGAIQRTPTARGPVQSSASFWDAYTERNQLFVNDGTGRFRDRSVANGPFGTPGVSRALAWADLRGDGVAHLLVNRVGTSARVYRSVAARKGHWLEIQAVDPALGGRDAYGAEITIRTAGRSWKRWLNPAFSYMSSNDPRVQVGLGSADRVDSISVVWPDGMEETFAGQPADRVVVVRRGEGIRP